jgi:hypothetical protein
MCYRDAILILQSPHLGTEIKTLAAEFLTTLLDAYTKFATRLADVFDSSAQKSTNVEGIRIGCRGDDVEGTPTPNPQKNSSMLFDAAVDGIGGPVVDGVIRIGCQN